MHNQTEKSALNSLFEFFQRVSYGGEECILKIKEGITLKTPKRIRNPQCKKIVFSQ